MTVGGGEVACGRQQRAKCSYDGVKSENAYVSSSFALTHCVTLGMLFISVSLNFVYETEANNGSIQRGCFENERY